MLLTALLGSGTHTLLEMPWAYGNARLPVEQPCLVIFKWKNREST